jgi:hypothetical protein
MNLADGKILEASECEAVLDTLEERVAATLRKRRLDPELVVSACDRLVKGLDESLYLNAMKSLGIDEALGRKYIGEAAEMFSADSLHFRLAAELGGGLGRAGTYFPPGKQTAVTEEVYPLGVLLHVAAGNADGLPAFSVLEGLLTGNINILKLPAEEGGISVRLLLELIRTEPALAEYIYVFDYSSRDIVHLNKLIAVSDAVVVWGGAEAAAALRRLIPPNTRLIEWGHKVSFAYVTKLGLQKGGLPGLAKNIAETGQLLCSSIQGICVDTDDMDDVYGFCESFLPVLEEAVAEASRGIGDGLRAQAALKLYTEELEAVFGGGRVYRGRGCSLTAYEDGALDTSIQLGNAWVRRLPRSEIVARLHPYKSYLQTVGLLCADSERGLLAELLFRAGAVRVCPGESMSETYSGQPHDGEHALRRYTKIVSLE